MKFKSIFFLCILLLSEQSYARENFQFNFSDKVKVLSDKAYRKTKDNYFEAIGNVIITQGTEAIYGEKATMSLKTGDTEVVGNVRYIAPNMTMYGARLDYNFLNQKLNLYNARIMTESYVVLGKKISRISQNVITGVDAEYTTCRDCPESWSVFGKKVHITVGEYIKITHAYIKINGVVMIYLPYVVLPIKKERQTGLLFPSFGVGLNEGVRFQQPWFWAIGPYNDMTLTPSIFGKRGVGNELQYRHVLAEKTWFELNSLQARDGIWEPEKEDRSEAPGHTFRHFSTYEHNWTWGNFLTHHFSYSHAQDLDMARDYNRFTESKILGSEVGGETFFNARTSLFDLNIEGHFNRNQLVPDAKEFDHGYVQILPKITLSTTPYVLLDTNYPFLKNISAGGDIDFTAFKQNHITEAEYIRNARRVNATPYIDWHFGSVGPVFFKTRATLDYQYYHFPYETHQRFFEKRGVVYETEMKLEAEKIFGLAYRENYEGDEVELIKKKEKKKKKKEAENIIGKLPESGLGYVQEKAEMISHSYRHSSEYKLKHYFLSDQQSRGSEQFANQIRESSDGRFDFRDSIREKQFDPDNISTSLPLNNTVEFQWNNSLIKKSARKFNLFQDERYLRDNFYYEKIAYFNLSQGYDFHANVDDLIDRLTRLKLEGGLSFGTWGISGTEYYIYNTQTHSFQLFFNKNLDRLKFDFGLRYDSISSTVQKHVVTAADFTLTETIGTHLEYDYDIEENRNTRALYRLLYTPKNNCWKAELDYETSLIEKRYSLNFLINFSENNFRSISEK